MLFALGYICGITSACLIVAVLVFFKNPIERIVEVTKVKIESVGPRPKGFVFEPEDEAEEIRQGIIAKNSAEGRDTPISELR